MPKNYSEELKELIEKFKDKGFEWGKSINYLEFRNGCSKEEMIKEILDCSNVEYVEKQRVQEETIVKDISLSLNSQRQTEEILKSLTIDILLEVSRDKITHQIEAKNPED